MGVTPRESVVLDKRGNNYVTIGFVAKFTVFSWAEFNPKVETKHTQVGGKKSTITCTYPKSTRLRHSNSMLSSDN